MFFSKKSGEGSRISLFNWILIVLIIVQGSSQLLEFFTYGQQSAWSFLPDMWISLGRAFTDNWFPASVALILLTAGYTLYQQLTNAKSSKSAEEKKERIRTIFLLLINLALCNRIYSAKSLLEKVDDISAHIPTAIVVSILLALGILTLIFISRHQKVNQELEGRSAAKSNDSASHADNPEFPQNNIDEELKFRMRHPFSYALRSFIGYLAENRKLKQDLKKEKLQTKISVEKARKQALVQDIRKGKHTYMQQDKFGTVAAALSLVICALLVCVLCFDDNARNVISPILNGVAQNAEKVAEFFNQNQQPLIELLISLGIPFLAVVAFLTIFLLLYICMRVVFYFLTDTGEDNDKILRCGKLIKIFVFTTIDSVLRLLLFVPDFIEHVEMIILGTDLDEKIQEFYPNAANRLAGGGTKGGTNGSGKDGGGSPTGLDHSSKDN